MNLNSPACGLVDSDFMNDEFLSHYSILNIHQDQWINTIGAVSSSVRSDLPSAAVSSSVSGLKSRRPAMARAVTISGEVTKQCVAGLASLRPVKLRLYDVTIVFLVPFFTSCLFETKGIQCEGFNMWILGQGVFCSIQKITMVTLIHKM